MICTGQRTIGIFIGILLLQTSLFGQQEESKVSSLPLEIQESVVQPARPESPAVIIITLYNRSTTAPVINIDIKIATTSRINIERQLDTLPPSEARYFYYELPAAPDNPYLIAEYNWNGRNYSVAKAVTAPVPVKTNSLWPIMLPIIVPALSSFLGVILGALLLHILTTKRERNQNRLAWGKMLFEKYEPAYREFKNKWGKIPSATALQHHFETLRVNTLIIPESIESAYKEAHETLMDGKASEGKKRQACIKLQSTIDNFLLKPW